MTASLGERLQAAHRAYLEQHARDVRQLEPGSEAVATFYAVTTRHSRLRRMAIGPLVDLVAVCEQLEPDLHLGDGALTLAAALERVKAAADEAGIP